MRRITVEEVSIAVHKTGARLARGTTWIRPMIEARGAKPCGCPLGILASTGLLTAPYRMDLDQAAKALELGHDYAHGFADGFDGNSITISGDDYADRLLGYQDGRAVAAALLPREGVAS